MACKLRVFLSHSACPEDKGLVDGIVVLAKKRKGINLYIAENDKQPGRDLNEKIEKELKDCDCVWALLTPKGNSSAFVQNEIGAAHKIKRRIIPMLEEGEALQGMLGGLTEYVRFNRSGHISPIENILDALEQRCEEIKRECAETSDELVKKLNLRIKEIEEENAKLRKVTEDIKLSASTVETKDRQLFDLAYEFEEQGRHAAAEALYTEYLKKQPGSATAHNNLGVALGKQGKTEEEIAEYREAIHLDPGDAQAHFNLGVALWEKGEPEEVIKEFRKAIRLKPGYAEALENLAIMLDVKGERKEARGYWVRAVKLEKRPEWVERIKKRLAEPD
jgi:tetratricopeptide (TPR) repeat protein